MNMRVSELMDGELDRREASQVVGALHDSAGMQEEWSRFHLIGDAMRGERCRDADFTHRVMAALEKEPTVLAPHRGASAIHLRPSLLTLAASLAGVAVVGWLAIGGSPQPVAIEVAASHQQTVAPVIRQEPISVVTAPPTEKLQEYLVAHHARAPMAEASGARYVRTVSVERRAP